MSQLPHRRGVPDREIAYTRAAGLVTAVLTSGVYSWRGSGATAGDAYDALCSAMTAECVPGGRP